MAKGLEMSGKDDLIKNSSITDVKEYTVDGKSTDAAMRLAKKVDAEMEQIKSQGSLERLRLVRQVFDLTVPKRASVATAPFKIEAKHEGQGLLEAIANERPLLWAAFQEVPDLKLMAYASVMKGFDANVLEMGSVVSVDAAGKVHVTSPDGSSTHTADLFPWDIADAAERRIAELEGSASAEAEPKPAAAEPAPLRPDGRTPIVDGLEGAPPLRAVAPDKAPAPKENKESKEYTTEELQALVKSGLIEGISLDENTVGPHGLTVAINKIDSNAGLPTYVATIDFALKSKNPDRSKSFHFEIEFDAQKDVDPSAFTTPINERVNKRVDRWERRMDRRADVAEEEAPEPAPTPAKVAPAEAIEEGPKYTQEELQKLLPDVLIAGLDLEEGVDFVEGSFRLELNESESNIQANQYEARVLFVLRDELGDAGLKQVKFTAKFDGSLSDLNEIAAPIIAKMNRRVNRWENRLEGETDAKEAAPAAPEVAADKFEKLRRNRPYEYLHEETKVLIYSDRVVFNGEEYSLKLNGEDTPLLSIANNKDIVLSSPSLNRADDMADWSEIRFPLEHLFHQLEDGKTEVGYDFSKILLIDGAAEPVARNGVKITLEKLAPEAAPAPTETVDQKEEARKALEDQLNGDEVAKQIMADIYAEYLLVDGTAANDVRFKVSSRNGDRFKYTFKYMISKDGEETVYESDELRGNLKRLDEVKSFVKNRLLLDYKGNEMVRPNPEYSAPAAEATEIAEDDYSALLAQAEAWTPEKLKAEHAKLVLKYNEKLDAIWKRVDKDVKFKIGSEYILGGAVGKTEVRIPVELQGYPGFQHTLHLDTDFKEFPVTAELTDAQQYVVIQSMVNSLDKAAIKAFANEIEQVHELHSSQKESKEAQDAYAKKLEELFGFKLSERTDLNDLQAETQQIRDGLSASAKLRVETLGFPDGVEFGSFELKRTGENSYEALITLKVNGSDFPVSVDASVNRDFLKDYLEIHGSHISSPNQDASVQLLAEAVLMRDINSAMDTQLIRLNSADKKKIERALKKSARKGVEKEKSTSAAVDKMIQDVKDGNLAEAIKAFEKHGEIDWQNHPDKKGLADLYYLAHTEADVDRNDALAEKYLGIAIELGEDPELLQVFTDLYYHGNEDELPDRFKAIQKEIRSVSDEAKAFVERIQDPSEHPSLDEYQAAMEAAGNKMSEGAIARAALLAVARDNGAGGIRFDQAQVFLDALNVEGFATYNAKMRFHEAAGNTAEAIKYARAYINGPEGTGLGSKNEEDLAYAKQILINNAVSN